MALQEVEVLTIDGQHFEVDAELLELCSKLKQAVKGDSFSGIV